MKYKGYLLIALYVALTAIFLSVSWMMYYPYNPIRVDSVWVEKDVYQRGECLRFQFQGEKFHPVPVSVTVELVNGERYHLVSYSANNPPGKVFKVRSIIIPYNIKPDKYTLNWTGVYEMNPFNTQIRTVSSGWIEVK